MWCNYWIAQSYKLKVYECERLRLKSQFFILVGHFSFSFLQIQKYLMHKIHLKTTFDLYWHPNISYMKFNFSFKNGIKLLFIFAEYSIVDLWLDSECPSKQFLLQAGAYTEAATGSVLQNRCSWKFRNMHRKTPVLEYLFNNVVDLNAWTLLKTDSNTSVILQILQKVYEQFFL